MTVEIVISSAVVGAIISLIGNIIAAKIAQRTAVKTAQETTNHEIKKLEKTWEREDVVSSDEEFAEMACAVAKYVHRNTIDNGVDATGKVASVRSKEHGELGRILDSLHENLDKRDLEGSAAALSKAIEEKRRLKGDAGNHPHPDIKDK